MQLIQFIVCWQIKDPTKLCNVKLTIIRLWQNVQELVVYNIRIKRNFRIQIQPLHGTNVRHGSIIKALLYQTQTTLLSKQHIARILTCHFDLCDIFSLTCPFFLKSSTLTAIISIQAKRGVTQELQKTYNCLKTTIKATSFRSEAKNHSYQNLYHTIHGFAPGMHSDKVINIHRITNKLKYTCIYTRHGIMECYKHNTQKPMFMLRITLIS